MFNLQLTYTGVLVAVFANQLCLPVPSIVFLMAAGALSAHGKMSGPMVAIMAIVPCLLADGLWFWFGRRWGSQALRVLCRFTSDPRGHSDRAHHQFQRYGLPLLLVAKFLPGIDGLIPPLAGAEGVSFLVFLALDAVGSLLWSAAYTGLGYVSADQLDLAVKWAKHFGTALLVAIVVPVFLYAAWRGVALLRMIRTLSVRRISPGMLRRKLESNCNVAVLDLREFDDEQSAPAAESIPGAIRVDPAHLRHSPPIVVQEELQIVLCCSSQGEITSARVAIALQKIGVKNLWVLEGGLKAWQEKGHPLSVPTDPPEVVASRFGVRLPA